ncbi:MAG: biotin--[acetyl-CoA-carboxylase] ligase [Acidimicrobiales bacterium]|nr:biotin--[acetyl-CoA-carboxylase] ligase [Acidimicrobiales bacterium]
MDPTRATCADRFLPESAAVAAALGPGPLGHVEVTGSTNADLAAEARAGDGGGAVLVADHQTAGRGRLDRTWVDEPGSALLVSLRVPTTPAAAAAVVAAVGAAARAAADGHCPDAVRAKWPNDLVVEDGAAPGKLAGVLAEFVDGDRPCVIVGVGINVGPAARPPGATSIAACGGAVTRDALLADLLRELPARLADPMAVAAEMRSNSATLGSRVRVELPDGADLVGSATDITAEGHLVVLGDDGASHTVATGDVIHLRPA